VPKLVDLQLPWTIRRVGFHAESLSVVLRQAADYVDKRMASDDWDVNKKVYDVVVSFEERYEGDDEDVIADETWEVMLYVDGGTKPSKKQQEIENERNFLLRRIAELESKLGLNPWWMEDSE
jgi:hypothetical protein